MASIELFTPILTDKPWGTELLVAHVPKGWQDRAGQHFGGYAGKVLTRYADNEHHRAGLQYHPYRDETFYLYEGQAHVYFVDPMGELRVVRIDPGQSVHVPAGVIHSVETLTDSVMFEASAGPLDSSQTINVEQDYDISLAERWFVPRQEGSRR